MNLPIRKQNQKTNTHGPDGGEQKKQRSAVGKNRKNVQTQKEVKERTFRGSSILQSFTVPPLRSLLQHSAGGDRGRRGRVCGTALRNET
jgi:hypothetical protein